MKTVADEAQCRFCALLKEVASLHPDRPGYYRCAVGRFDVPLARGDTALVSLPWSGICAPNEKVAVVQKGCHQFKISPQGCKRR